MTDQFLGSYLPYLLRQADQALSAAFYGVLSASGIERSEWRVISVLEESGSLSMRDLTKTALSPQPTVTHAVARLEKRGLVKRSQGTEDRRKRFVSVTPAGHALAIDLMKTAASLEAETLEAAGVNDVSALVEQLRVLHECLAATTAQKEPHDA